MSARLQQALETLYGLERRKDKLGLEGTRVLLEALGNPHRRFRSIHVAGTNGKGSVCALIERVLRESGHRTGLFTSPHLVDFRERIRVAGRWVDADALERRLHHVQSLPEGRERTFFEVSTALAFDAFAAQGVEIAVVEVGLGGRLDCTNVILPQVSVITSIGLDHQEILGTRIEDVAAEKAGIIKPGVPVVAAVGPAAARTVIARIAGERGAPIVEVEPPDAAFPEAPGLRGPHQRHNLALARAALDALRATGVAIASEAVPRGLALARWPGRFEACPTEPRLWWDGAHNPQAMGALSDAWLAHHGTPPQAVVLALSRDKDVAAILDVLGGRLRPARLIATRTRSARALDPQAIVEHARRWDLRPEALPDVGVAARRALEVAGSGRVLLTGSLFAVGEAMEAFGGAPGEML